MIYLLDTHIILWTLFDPGKLTEQVASVLENDTDRKVVSGINLWEISIKYSLGKLELPHSIPDQMLKKIIESGFEV